MLRFEPLEPRCVPSRYTLTDLGDFHGHGMNDWGLVAGVDAAGNPALWLQGQVTELPLPAGFRSAGAQCVNDWGQVGGYGRAADGSGHALFWDSQGVIDLGGNGGAVDGINDLGQLAGYLDPSGQAVFWSPYRPVETFGRPQSIASAINDAGMATGSDGDSFAFRWQNGVMTDLPYPVRNGDEAIGFAIDRTGDIAGLEVLPGGVNEAVVWPATGRPYGLGVPAGYLHSRAYGINDSGQVVGYVSGSVSRAFLWDQAHGFQDLNTLTRRHDFTLTVANQITDGGMILATATSPGNPQPHTVILTPVPDQAPAWLAWALDPHRRQETTG